MFSNAKIWTVAKILPNRLAQVDWHVATIRKHKATYEQAERLTGVPWFVIGIIHGLEANYNFNTIIANGDPLNEPTRDIPRGLIAHNWVEGVLISFQHEGWMHLTGWNLLSNILDRLEAYNGPGYRLRGIPSPYLYSFTNVYKRGKFTADEHFDPDAVSEQCGAVAILLRLVQLGILTVNGSTMTETPIATINAGATAGLNTSNSQILSTLVSALTNSFLAVGSPIAILLHGMSWWHFVSAGVTFGVGVVGAAYPVISLLNSNAATILNTVAAVAGKAAANVDQSTGPAS